MATAPTERGTGHCARGLAAYTGILSGQYTVLQFQTSGLTACCRLKSASLKEKGGSCTQSLFAASLSSSLTKLGNLPRPISIIQSQARYARISDIDIQCHGRRPLRPESALGIHLKTELWTPTDDGETEQLGLGIIFQCCVELGTFVFEFEDRYLERETIRS